jgi:hypothetical protein
MRGTIKNMDNIIQQIETAVKERLKSKLPKVGEFDVGKDFSAMLSTPALSVTTEKIGVEKVLDYYELRPVVSVYAAVKGVQPTDRHMGVYPIVTYIVADLTGKILGLDIEPLEPAGPMVEVFHPAAIAQGLRLYKVDFQTAFELNINDDETLERLLVTVNDYIHREYEFETQEITLPNNIEGD